MNLKIINRITNVIDTSSDSVVDGMGGVENQIYRVLLEELNNVSGRNGVMELGEGGVETLLRIESRIRDAVSRSNYGARVVQYLKSFDQVLNLNGQLFAGTADMGLNNIRNAAVRFTAEKLLDSGINSNFYKPIQDIIYKYAATGGSVQQAQQELSVFVLGDQEKLGTLQRYVGQVARDSISQYDGAINQKISKELGLNGVMYVGSLITDSRAQCRKWVGMRTISNKVLEQEIEWAERGGTYEGKQATGWISGTTIDSFLINRGGYNCRHRAIPVRVEE